MTIGRIIESVPVIGPAALSVLRSVKRFLFPYRGPIFTEIPDRAPIRLDRFYQEFVWYYPQCEMQTKAWCVKHIGPDWVVIDAGANIGYYSILFSQLAPKGRIFSFEPTKTVEMLRHNLKSNHVENCEVLKMALGNKEGAIKENVFRIWGNAPERLVYDFTSIDRFVQARNLDRVDCIKIDVDSFDFEVLQGAVNTLKHFNPWIVVELNSALAQRWQCNQEALLWMAEQGYQSTLLLDLDNFVFKRDERLDTGEQLKLDVFFEKACPRCIRH